MKWFQPRFFADHEQCKYCRTFGRVYPTFQRYGDPLWRSICQSHRCHKTKQQRRLDFVEDE